MGFIELASQGRDLGRCSLRAGIRNALEVSLCLNYGDYAIRFILTYQFFVDEVVRLFPDLLCGNALPMQIPQAPLHIQLPTVKRTPPPPELPAPHVVASMEANGMSARRAYFGFPQTALADQTVRVFAQLVLQVPTALLETNVGAFGFDFQLDRLKNCTA